MQRRRNRPTGSTTTPRGSYCSRSVGAPQRPYRVAGMLIVAAALLGLAAPNTWPVWAARAAALVGAAAVLVHAYLRRV